MAEPIVMRMDRKPFDEIKEGKKIWEVRVNDEKREKIRTGDTIILMRRPEFEEKLNVVVEERQLFLNVQRLLDKIPLHELGVYPTELDFIQTIMNHYTPKAMNDHGLVAMRIKVSK